MVSEYGTIYTAIYVVVDCIDCDYVVVVCGCAISVYFYTVVGSVVVAVVVTVGCCVDMRCDSVADGVVVVCVCICCVEVGVVVVVVMSVAADCAYVDFWRRSCL